MSRQVHVEDLVVLARQRTLSEEEERRLAIALQSSRELECLYDAGVHFDGQLQVAIKQGDKVTVQRAEKTVSLLHPLGHSHYDMLREKLNWG